MSSVLWGPWLFQLHLHTNVQHKRRLDLSNYEPNPTQHIMKEWMNTYIYIAPVKQKSSEALAAE